MSSPPASGPPGGTAGTITFLFTDIEGSTRLLEEAGADYGELLAVHRRLLRAAFCAHRGREVDTQGDSFFVAFASPSDAVANRPWPPTTGPPGRRVRVRMGLHGALGT